MQENPVEKIYKLLEDHESSLVVILDKAINLAILCNTNDYIRLFQLHREGVPDHEVAKQDKMSDDEKSERISSVDEKWQLRIKEFVSDRTQSDGTVTFVSATRLETNLRELRKLKQTAESTAEKDGNSELYKTYIEIALAENGMQEIISRIRNRVSIYVAMVEKSVMTATSPQQISNNLVSKKVFIGHGRSLTWRDLKDFLQDRLELDWDEFNRESPAGLATKERLTEMLDDAAFAFLVMTAEDEHTDHTLHARENVIHEIGLFQGRLGFRKAIILLEDGCKEFSNVIGLTQIRFPKGNIRAEFEEIRRVLEREGLLENRIASP